VQCAKRFSTSAVLPFTAATAVRCSAIKYVYIYIYIYNAAVYKPLADTSAGCPAINYREATKVDISETCSLLCRRGEWACGVGVVGDGGRFNRFGVVYRRYNMESTKVYTRAAYSAHTVLHRTAYYI